MMIRNEEERILVIGDIHGNLSALKTLYDVHTPDIMIQCGDFGYFPFTFQSAIGGIRHFEDLKKVNCPVYFCDGNHEHHELLSKLKKDELPFDYPGLEHVQYMRRGDTYTTQSGDTILFLGGANSIDKHRRIPGWDWFPGEILTMDVLNRIPDDIDIVISHTCPSSFIDSDGFRDFEIDRYEEDPSRDVLEVVLNKYAPKKWYFGHWHKRISGRHKTTDWTCLSNVTINNMLDENCSWCWM